jgi:peptidoglycan/xylan/chitin deacetylase (PgdA/CDA1 family)
MLMVFALIFIMLLLAILLAYDFWVRFGMRFIADVCLRDLRSQIFLSYDDGPASSSMAWGDSIKDAQRLKKTILDIDPGWRFEATTTANLARVLAEFDRRAVFFIHGENLETDRSTHEVILDLHHAGHVIANHSFSHTRFMHLTKEQCIDEVRRTDALLRGITGQAPVLFRPPYGQWHFSRTLQMWRRPSLCNYALPLGWSHATRDWEMTCADLSYEKIRDKVTQFLDNVRSGNSGTVLLQHDVWIYAVLYTKVLLEELCNHPEIRIGEPSLLVDHAQRITESAKRWGGLPYYLKERGLLLKGRLRSVSRIQR